MSKVIKIKVDGENKSVTTIPEELIGYCVGCVGCGNLLVCSRITNFNSCDGHIWAYTEDVKPEPQKYTLEEFVGLMDRADVSDTITIKNMLERRIKIESSPKYPEYIELKQKVAQLKSELNSL